MYAVVAVMAAGLFISGCKHGSGESFTSHEAVHIPAENVRLAQDPDYNKYDETVDALKRLDIETVGEFRDAFAKEDALAFFLKLQQEKASLQPESMFRLMRDIEYKSLLLPLAQKENISEAAVESLKLFKKPLCQIQSDELRSFRDESASESVKESFYRQKWRSYNETLRAYGKEPLSYESFTALRRAVEKINPYFVYYGQEMQNVVLDDNTTKSSKLRVFAKSVNGVQVLNPVMEETLPGTLPPQRYIAIATNRYGYCTSAEANYPMQVMGYILQGEVNGRPIMSDINTSNVLIGNTPDGKRYFQINRMGLATITVHNRSDASVPFTLTREGTSLIDTQIDANETKRLYLPVFKNDVCTLYEMTRADTSLDVTIERVDEPTVMQKVFDSVEGRYEIEAYLNNEKDEPFFNAGVYRFRMDGVEDGGTKTLYIENESENAIDYMIVSPSGEVSVVASAGGNLQIPLAAKNGKWFLYVLPVGSRRAAANNAKITALGLLDPVEEELLGSQIRISMVDSLARMKRFVVAELKDASFSHDGEKDGQRAEVFMKLHTNVAPRIGLDVDTLALYEDPKYDALKCWQEHGRDVALFNEGGACEAYKPNYERILWWAMPNAENGDELSEEEAPSIAQYSDAERENIMYEFERYFSQKVEDRYYTEIESSGVYDAWKTRSVQVNDIRFPRKYPYGVSDVSADKIEYLHYKRYEINPTIPVNMPIFASSKERLAEVSVPISFHYNAYDIDEVDAWEKAKVYMLYSINVASAVATQNYASLICKTVDLLKGLRQVEIDGEDDPIGEADFFLNRFSSTSSFYGLSDEALLFGFSGFATIPDYYTSYDRGLSYADLACSIYGLIQSATQFVSSVETASSLLSGDYIEAYGITELENNVLLTLTAMGMTTSYDRMKEAFEDIRNNRATQETVDTMRKIFQEVFGVSAEDAFGNGTDIFSSLSEASDEPDGLGGEGHNVMRSESNFYLSSFSKRKTRAKVRVKEVDALPLKHMKVVLDKVHIYGNMEDSDEAEVFYDTVVGVVGDKRSDDAGDSSYYGNGSGSFVTLNGMPFMDMQNTTRGYDGIEDDSDLPLEEADKVLSEKNWSEHNNVAAIYVQIGLFEDDAGGMVNDDTIGVLSHTIYLEDLYNLNGMFEVEPLGGKRYRIKVTDYPVYNAWRLESAVDFMHADKAKKQKEHNRKRLDSPSALISYHIDIELGDYIDYEPVDTNVSKPWKLFDGIDPIDPSTLSMREVDKIDESLEIADVFHDLVALYNKGGSTDGVIYLYERDGHSLVRKGTLRELELPAEYANLLNRSVFIKIIDERRIVVLRRFIPYETTAELLLMEVNASTGKFEVTQSMDVDAQGEYDAAQMAIRRMANGNATLYVSLVNFEDADYPSKLAMIDIDGNGMHVKSVIPWSYTILDLEYVDGLTLAVHGVDVHRTEKNEMVGNPQISYLYTQRYLDLWRDDGNDNLTLVDRQRKPFGVDYPVSKAPSVWEDSMTLMMQKGRSGLLKVWNGLMAFHFDEVSGTFALGDSVKKSNAILYHNMRINEEKGYIVSSRRLKVYRDLQSDRYSYKPDTEKMFEQDVVRQLYDDYYFMNGRYMIANGVVHLRDGQQVVHRVSLIDTLYKGTPKVTGEDFNKTLVLEHSNNYRGSIFFNVELNGTQMDEYDIEFTIKDDDTNETLFTGTDTTVENLNDPNTYWYSAKLTCQNNGVCRIDLVYDKKCTTKRHRYRVKVDWDSYVTEKSFDVLLKETTPYLGEDKEITIGLVNNAYERIVNLPFVSYPSVDKDPNSCVTQFAVYNAPSWLTYGTSFSLTANKMVLEFNGQPQIGDAGDYIVTVQAYNSKESDSAQLIIHVLQPDTTPDTLPAIVRSDVDTGSVVEASFVVNGIDAPAAISVSGGEYSIDGGATWRSDDASVTAGTQVRVRHTAANAYETRTRTVVTIGGVEYIFESVTKPDPAANDDTPNAFHFTDVTGVELGSVQEASVTITGITIPSRLSIVGGEYSIDGGKTWSTQSRDINNSTVVTVRHTASTQYDTETNTTLTVGGVSDTFTSRTKALEAPKIVLNATTYTFAFGDSVSISPVNSGGEADSWSLSPMLDGLIFQTSSGNIGGTIDESGAFDLNLSAVNSAGSDWVILHFDVSGTTPPNLDAGYGITLDNNTIDISFSDDANWRSAISGITVDVDDYNGGGTTVDLSEGTDYTVSSGRLSLLVNGNNRVPTIPGDWTLKVRANGYDDAQVRFYVSEGAIDAQEVNASLVLENAPFLPWHRTTVKLRLSDRFGNKIAYGGVTFSFNAVDNDATYIEPYKAVDEQGVSHLMRPTPLHPNVDGMITMYADENGSVSLPIDIPAYVDVDDGFDLSIKTDTDALIRTIRYRNSSTNYVPTDWNVRFNASHIAQKSDGSAKYRIAEYPEIVAHVAADNRGYAYVAVQLQDTETNWNNAVYVVAIDPNGVARWTQRLIGEVNASLVPKDMRYENGSLYVAMVTSGDFSSVSGETNSGANDAAYAEINATTGAVIVKRSWGNGNDQTVLTLERVADGVNLYATDRDDATTRVIRFKDNGTIGGEDTLAGEFEALLPYASDKVVATYASSGAPMNAIRVSTGEDLWSVYNDGRSPGESDYNYASIRALWGDTERIYAIGDAKIGFFDDTFAVDSVYYTTLLQRTTDGALMWSRAFTEQPRGSSNGVLGGRIGNVIYAAYNTNEQCTTNSGEIACAGMRLSALNFFTGETITSALWKTDYKTEVVGGSTVHSSRNLKPLDLTASDTSKSVYVLGTTNGALADTVDSEGVNEIFLMRTVRDDNASDTRPTSGWVRNSRTDVVTDYATRLQWEDNQYGLDFGNWNSAVNTLCQNERLDGRGWRLPTSQELEALIDTNQPSAPYLKSIFQERTDDTPFWTTDEVDADNAVAVYFDRGTPDGMPKSDNGYVRCVRPLP